MIKICFVWSASWVLVLLIDCVGVCRGVEHEVKELLLRCFPSGQAYHPEPARDIPIE